MVGDIIFVRTNNFIGKEIRKITNGYYNHVGLMISDTEIIEATYKGVRLTTIKKYENLKNKGKAEYKIASVKGVRKADAYSVAGFAYCKIGLNYDFMQIIFLYVYFLLKINRKIKPFDCKSAFICSELISEGYSEVGINFNKNVAIDLITPADLEKSDLIVFTD